MSKRVPASMRTRQDGIAERIRPGQCRDAGPGGLGLRLDGHPGAVAPCGGVQGRPRDGERLNGWQFPDSTMDRTAWAEANEGGQP